MLDRVVEDLFVVPTDLAALSRYADAHGYDERDPWTATLWAIDRALDGRARRWPPEPHEPCWCGRPRLYDDCCRWRDDRT